VGFEGQIRPRSSMSKVGVHCALGTLDAGFRGIIGATLTLLNSGNKDFEIHIGDKVAQLVLAPVARAEFAVAERLSSSERGEGGWGSSGRQ
jgi:dUTP pyrophosphatase